MNGTVWISALAIGCCSIAAAAQNSCPALPKNSGMSWVYEMGPDFDVCHAERPAAAPTEQLGVYMGYAPSFDHGWSYTIWSVLPGLQWVVAKTPGGSTFKVGAEALESLGGGKRAHIWVFAQDEDSLSRLKDIAEDLSF